MQTFLDMLTYKRPMDSTTEIEFIDKFLVPLGTKPDAAGNAILKIGDNDVLWSSHTDTVHYMGGKQTLSVGDSKVTLGPISGSNCLGADCTTGVYIMTEMIKAKVPGTYVFHRGEERGSHGSKFIAKDKTILKGIRKAIAFDRYGTSSVITYQGNRTASDKFAASVTEQLPFLKADSGGLFTDTANYDHLIPECTNFSVGYIDHHTSRESQDLTYLKFFIEKMKKFDTNKLVVARDPNVIDHSWGDSYGSYDMSPWNFESSKPDKMKQLVKNNPGAAASLLSAYGVSTNELMEHIFAYSN